MSTMTPREIASELDRFIVGQKDAKRAVAIALRNRWRRMQLDETIRHEITPKNILMIGPTGVGKPEIARRLARLANAPFIKVEATKFTEVGYVGRDVEQIARDLAEDAIRLEKDRRREAVREAASKAAMDRLLKALVGENASEATRESFRQRIVENAMRDPFDHWLADNPQEASKLLEWVIARADERVRRRQEKEVSRKSAVRKLRLPGKLADCTQNAAAGAELFIVEGDSAGGSAKQARNRASQAVLPLRGKILNVASAGREKLTANQQIADLIQALGCGTRSEYREEDLRYDRVIIMTDADVDGAHIASLLITFFYQEMPELIRGGHLYLAVPPLYKLTQGGKTMYARDDAHKDELMRTEFTGRGKVELGRFKGLGEMLASQLKETTMDPAKRTLLRVMVPETEDATKASVDALMGTKPEARFRFIQERAEFAGQLDI